MKKIKLGFLLFTLMFVLAACGGGSVDDTPTNGTDTVQTPDSAENGAPADDASHDESSDDDGSDEGSTSNGSSGGDGYAPPGFDDEGSADDDDPVQDDAPEELLLTLQELSEFDGRNGRRALIAVDGIIYEVTGSSRWPNGAHNGHQAGQDLTEEIDTLSPHGRRTLDRMPRVGRIIEE